MALTTLIAGLALVNVLCVSAHVAPRLDTYRSRSSRRVYSTCDVLYMYYYCTMWIHSCQSTILNQNVYKKEGFFFAVMFNLILGPPPCVTRECVHSSITVNASFGIDMLTWKGVSFLISLWLFWLSSMKLHLLLSEMGLQYGKLSQTSQIRAEHRRSCGNHCSHCGSMLVKLLLLAAFSPRQSSPSCSFC